MTKYTSSVVHYHFSIDVVHTDVDRLVNLIPRLREDHETRCVLCSGNIMILHIY